MGFVLVQRRKYELELVSLSGSPSTSTRQALPWTWERPLEPGVLIHMNTYVRRLDLLCPACSTPIDLDQLSVPDHGWVAW